MLSYGYRSERKLLKSLTLDITISLERTEVYYNTMNEYVIADQFQSNNDIYFERSNEEIEPVFTSEEIESIVKKCPNGKSCGIDGVSYEDIKDNWLREGHNIVKIFNTILGVFYGRRSENNWYTGKRDTKPEIIIQSQLLMV